MRGPELVDELAEGARFLDRAKVRALQVLDEGELELVATRKLSDDGGHPFQAGHLCGAYATLSGDELVSVEGLSHHDRLQDAVLTDADRKLLERFLIDAPAWLPWIAADARNRDLRQGRRGGRTLGDQRCEASSEAGMGTSRTRGHRATASGARSPAPGRAARAVARGTNEVAAGRPSWARNSRASERYASAPFDSGL